MGDSGTFFFVFEAILSLSHCTTSLNAYILIFDAPSTHTNTHTYTNTNTTVSPHYKLFQVFEAANRGKSASGKIRKLAQENSDLHAELQEYRRLERTYVLGSKLADDAKLKLKGSYTEVRRYVGFMLFV